MQKYVNVSTLPDGRPQAFKMSGDETNVTKLSSRKQENPQRRTAHSTREGMLCAAFLKKSMTRKRIKKARLKAIQTGDITLLYK